MFLRILKHLLPSGRAWQLTVDKQLRQFFSGLADALADVKAYLDLIYLDLLPATTRELDAWERVWNLSGASILTTQERRDRLDAAWKALGGQSPRYIQDTLQAAGFPVYVHEWWVPGSEPGIDVHGAATARNPLTYLFPTSGQSQSGVECGEPLAQCGEPTAQCGNVLGTLGYPLVNKILRASAEFTVLCGEPLAQCGETTAACGEYVLTEGDAVLYTIPPDPATWPYFLYIGDATFGDLAAIPMTRKSEFEKLCLTIAPCQQWLGIMVQYT